MTTFTNLNRRHGCYFTEQQVSLTNFIASTMEVKIKSAAVKFNHYKHPTGFAERQLNKEWRDNDPWWTNARAARKAAKASSIREGFEEIDFIPESGSMVEPWNLSDEGFDEAHVDEWRDWDDFQSQQRLVEIERREEEEFARKLAEAYDYTPESEYVSSSSQQYFEEAFHADGEEHVYEDEQEFYTKQECGSLMEDETYFTPPAHQEFRFDTLGGAAARNVYMLNRNLRGLTGLKRRA